MSPQSAIAEEFKQYAYSVSHDVSAPVRAMVEFSKLLSAEDAKVLSADSKEYLSLIVENGVKLQAMMEGLLRYSRLNTLAKPFELVDLNFVAQTAIADMQSRVVAQQAVIELSHLPSLAADHDQMYLLFHELIDNALKFQPAGRAPKIRISTQQANGELELSIADNGFGIDPKYQGSVFNLFKRLHADDEYPGVGIGLTLAKKIVERHGGTIACGSNSPNGCVFTITLPAMEA